MAAELIASDMVAARYSNSTRKNRASILLALPETSAYSTRFPRDPPPRSSANLLNKQERLSQIQ